MFLSWSQLPILIWIVDEVESLTAARAGAMAGTEPSDGLRVSHFSLKYPVRRAYFQTTQVVNALLTQLDKLKHRRNVLVMATSNLVKAIGRMFPFLYSRDLFLCHF